jgi:predicted nucleic acid-binding Zn ribbon protein
MLRKNSQNIREIIQEMMQSQPHLSKGIIENRVVQNWPKIMGPTIERATRRVYFSKGVLYVELNSSVVRNELNMLREKIVRSMNQSVGANVVTEIVLR